MQNFYIQLNRRLRKNPSLCRMTIFLGKTLPYLYILIFAVVITVLLAVWDLKWIYFLTVPFLAFMTVTVLRKLLNWKRPFEVYAFTPLVKHKPGESFPSRHTASAFAIAAACLYVNIILGILCFICAAGVAVTRVLMGVHFIRDVVSGAAVSIIIAAAGWLVSSLCFGL